MSTEQIDTNSRPKPRPFVPKPSESSTPSSATTGENDKLVKKPFVRKPHLTDRPFKNEALEKLRADLNQKKPAGKKYNKNNVRHK